MIISRSIHVAANGIISFFFYGWVVFTVYMYHIFFIRSSVDGCLGCFCVWLLGIGQHCFRFCCASPPRWTFAWCPSGHFLPTLLSLQPPLSPSFLFVLFSPHLLRPHLCSLFAILWEAPKYPQDHRFCGWDWPGFEPRLHHASCVTLGGSVDPCLSPFPPMQNEKSSNHTYLI